MREVLKHIKEHPFPDVTIFPDNRPHYFRRDTLGKTYSALLLCSSIYQVVAVITNTVRVCASPPLRPADSWSPADLPNNNDSTPDANLAHNTAQVRSAGDWAVGRGRSEVG